MGELTECNYCKLQRYKQNAKKEGKRIILKKSNFMGGINVFKLDKKEEVKKYIEPCDKYLNGDAWYQTHIISWMGAIGDRCEC